MNDKDQWGDKIILPDDPDFNRDTVTIVLTPQELDLTRRIAQRYKLLVETNSPAIVDQQIIWMDVAICHSNGCPLDLQKLLDAPGQALYDDVRGIELHIHRRSGKLRGFTPRFKKE